MCSWGPNSDTTLINTFIIFTASVFATRDDTYIPSIENLHSSLMVVANAICNSLQSTFNLGFSLCTRSIGVLRRGDNLTNPGKR